MIETVCGAELHYEVYGTGPKDLLLLHGWGCDGTFFRSLIDSFQGEFRVIVPDFPGNGQSGFPPEPWGVEEYARCVLALLDRLHSVKPRVICHSFGCRVVLKMFQLRPDVFEKVVITGGAGLRKPESGKPSKKTVTYRRLKKLVLLLGKIPFSKPLSDMLLDKLQYRFGSPDYRALSVEMRKTFVKVITEELSVALPLVTAPTLLVWGDRDTETPLWMGQKMEKEIPDAGLVTLTGGTHFAFLEQAKAFDIICHQFLSEDTNA